MNLRKRKKIPFRVPGNMHVKVHNIPSIFKKWGKWGGGAYILPTSPPGGSGIEEINPGKSPKKHLYEISRKLKNNDVWKNTDKNGRENQGK